MVTPPYKLNCNGAVLFRAKTGFSSTLMNSLPSNEPEFSLLIIWFLFVKMFLPWLSGIRCNYSKFCFFKIQLSTSFYFSIQTFIVGKCWDQLLSYCFPRTKGTLSTRVSGMFLSPRMDIFQLYFLRVILMCTDMPNHGILCGSS